MKQTIQNTNTAVIFTVDPVQVTGLTDRQINNRLAKMADLDAQIKALEAQRDALKAEIIESMTGDTRETAAYKVSYKEVTTNRFDSKAFKADFPETYKQYQKPQTCRRFTYAAK